MVYDLSSDRPIPGPDANLPPYIYDRMIALDMRPTLSGLADMCGISHQALQKYLRGKREMRLSTAKRLAEALKVESIDTLLVEMPYLCHSD